MSSVNNNASCVGQLVADLEAASQLHQRGKSYKRTYDIFNSKHKVNSWKFNEWDYGKNNIKLPTNARGLFILDDPNDPRIVARGYDKFFNIDEVQSTRWEWIEEFTMGPYEVTVKSNGCIIFISALEDGTIVVCSKHSTGPRDDVDRNHALAGQAFLLRQLDELNVDSKNFAKELYENNLTAIAEYCDDTFEEHILEYGEKERGLYLHGLNLNEPEFKTLPMDKVHKFGEKYGFKPTESMIKEDIHSLRTFLEKCATEGSFQGRELEGFVIRCHLKENNKTFFFKYKFEEPYLMYRQWREVTKKYIEDGTRVFRFKKHKFITNKYLDFVIPLLDNDQQLRENYTKGFGIIGLRNLFLESYGMSGMEILNHEKIKELELRNAVDYNKIDENTKFLIFPIAVIGCGKTTTALTLTNLYKNQWGHIQNDDIRGKDKAQLIKRSLEKLSDPSIKCVFVDRNNHQYRERQQLFEWIDEYKEEYMSYDANIKVIGISFLDGTDLERVKEITTERVLARGDNHQTIQLNKHGEKKVIGIMSGFWKRFQPVDMNKWPDNAFDLLINLKVDNESSSLSNAREIIRQIHETYPVLIPDLPTENELEQAFKSALEHKPENIPKVVKGQPQKPTIKKLKPSFFSAAIKNKKMLLDEIQNAINLSEMNTSSVNKMVEENRTQPEFHITLSHVVQGKKGDAREKRIWSTYMKHYEDEMMKISECILKKRQSGESANPDERETFECSNGDHLKFKLAKLCWDDKIVSAIVELNRDIDHNTCVKDKNNQFINGLDCTNVISHITIGILNVDTKASYSNTLCHKVMEGDIEKVNVIDLSDTITHTAGICININ
ncbi:similar to Saccharomyces cerevisiae YJL087C TRL1 tRNA ligase, required for tRNA splicing and for both splicing and translation of HAC1 mRNA in the UPR [Maudiozyma saulgeensis]|uniref:tRNA ligase n=1 Tax=Maudiozyma saulgeensis TaxID=1789683 RepID=A0A1X7R7T7_9SACH|nr:similar to Saccharomyces cerevisiae YJL087C TRL1 tRNA ligase, required for tRNA splicing and for both splicing and translation of HAC1 mRNA in the UPR [Kazachstania saulgeensis]